MGIEKSRLKVGFLTALDPQDKRSWSGIHYRMMESLQTQFLEMVSLGPVKLSYFESFKLKVAILLFKVFHIVYYRSKPKSEHFLFKSKAYGRFFEKKIKVANVDLVFAPVASIEIAYLKTDVPIYYFSDTTFEQIWNYYTLDDTLSPLMRKKGNKIEQSAINNSSVQVFSSKWAADYAKDYYGAKNAFVTKMGANLDVDSGSQPTKKMISSVTNLLFIGVEWQRKGGPIVFEVFQTLLKKGFDIRLTVCGCVPPVEHPKMKVIPFLDKNREQDMLEIKHLYSQAHIFFMPTRAETYGIVFCEANSFGVPVVTTDTGGVSSIIENGHNGFLLPIEATISDYVEVIEKLISDQNLYQEMSENARLKYKEELNWGKWGIEIGEIIHKTMDNNEK